MADMNSQIGASIQQSELARQRAMADMQRQVDEMQRRAAWHQGIADRAAQAGQAMGGMAMGGAAHFYSNAATGAAYMYANAAQRASSAAAAFGMANLNLSGPDARGIPGPYLSAGQSFGGLLYEGGLGRGLNALTGNLFFRDVNQVLGLPPAMVGEMARDELALRGQKVFTTLGQGLPFSDYFGFRFNDIRDVTQRDVARRFSYLTGPAASLAGGRGIRSTSALAEGIARSLEDAGERFDRARGYSLSKEEELDIRSATMNLMSVTQGQNFANLSAADRDADIRKMRNVVHQMMANLRVSAKEAVGIAKEFGEFFSPESINQMTIGAQEAAAAGAAGALTPVQLMRMRAQASQAGLRLGMSDAQALQFGGTFINERGAILAQRRAGLLSYGDLFMYGGSNADEAAMLMAQANRRLGLQFAADPGIAMMYANRRGVQAMNQLAAGGVPGGIVGFMSAQAGVAAADPYAALRSRFDPQAKERQATTGLLAAFNQARSIANFSTVFGPGADTAEGSANRRAVAIAEFARLAGINDDVEAARQYDRLLRSEKMLGGAKEAFIYNQMQQLSPVGLDVDQAKSTVNRVLESVGGDINSFMAKPEYERRMLVERARRFDLTPTELEKEEYVNRRVTRGRIGGALVGLGAGIAAAPLTGGVGLFTAPMAGAAVGGEYARNAALDALSSGAAADQIFGIGDLTQSGLFSEASYRSGVAVNPLLALISELGDSEADIESAAKKLLGRGLSHHQLNAMLMESGATNFFFDASGDLRDRTSPDDSDATTRFGRASRVKSALVAGFRNLQTTKQLPESVLRGATREKAAETIRSMTSMSETSFLEQADVVRQVGIRRSESGLLGVSDQAALLQDPELLSQLQSATFGANQKDLYELISRPDIDASAALSAFSKQASQESMQNLQYLRGSRVASTLASSRGQTENNPMFVAQVRKSSGEFRYTG